jgi:hypothetical protein
VSASWRARPAVRCTLRSGVAERETEQADQRARTGSGQSQDNGGDPQAASDFQQGARKAERTARKERKEQAEKGPGFSLKRLHWAELVGFLGSLVLAGSLFLKWFATDCITTAAARAGEECNPNSVYNGERGEFTAFETFKYLDWTLVAACVAPFILAYIIARGHKLSWKPGEVTMIVGMIAVALILLNGIILGKPGDTVDMHFELGWLVGLIGAILIMLGGILRQALATHERKPPGVM